jgi:CRISPR-associated protein Cmr4
LTIKKEVIDMAEPFKKQVYYALTLDPVHIGTGGYRLGRVDNTITREPGTNLPKIPGSSIAGATRAYTAMAIQSQDPSQDRKKQKYQRPRLDKDGKQIARKDEEGKPVTDSNGQPLFEYDSCAGKGGDGGDSHCGEPDCQVCVPFGFSRRSGSSFQGLAQFYDARILFFPVHSMMGPVWVTSEGILKEHNITCNLTDKQKFKSLGITVPNNKLNFGWLMLEQENGSVSLNGNFTNIATEIKNRLLLVSDNLFSRIVNDNLEVRTSVAIDPATGAAEHGALYTYEAIPRGTVMWFDVVYNKPEYFRINGDKPILLAKPVSYVDPLRNPGLDDQIGYIAFNVQKGLKYLETLGVGGMNTRGMGRVRILNMGGPE